MISEKIFKAYDIRGIYPQEINEEISWSLGRALGLFLKKLKPKIEKPKFLIAYDIRVHSYNLFYWLKKGLNQEKINIINQGVIPTDVFYFLIQELDVNGGAMITASHNPKEYNGFKIVIGKPWFPYLKFVSQNYGLKEIKSQMIKIKKSKSQFKISNPQEKPKIKLGTDFCQWNKGVDLYVEKIINLIKPDQIKNFLVIIDCGNGCVGPVIKRIIKHYPLNFQFLHFDFNGNFPNRHPNPLEDPLKTLKKEIINQKADLGVAFDGDADRIIFLDEKANLISSDLIIALLAEEILQQNPQDKIVYNLTCSKIVEEIINELNGIPIKSKTGHTFIKENMENHQAIFGGEISGHFYYREMSFAESSILTLLYLLKILSQEQKTLSELIKKYQKYTRLGEINFKTNKRNQIIKKIENYYKNKGKEIEYLDGISIYFKNWWFNLRASNTEPIIRLVIEANNKKLAQEKKKEILKIISNL